ncbi:MAG: monovalent cation:proton antiporter-2 (CPA2) family protein [Steroidobacteraceae bacterium]
MTAESHGLELLRVVVLLAAGVIAVPLFKRLGLGSVLGYLVAGMLIGPSGLRMFIDPGAIRSIAELGVVMFLFIIGLEMQPARLWSLRRSIFGLGVLQVAVCGALLTGVCLLAGLAPGAAFIAALGFVLSSTAIVMQILEERGVVNTARAQRIVAILLLEDLAIVPLLAVVALLAPQSETMQTDRWLVVLKGVGYIAALLLVGRFVLNPMFRLLAASHAREVMTGAALLVVIGSAVLMEMGGMSMAMGAFLAGVLLSESTFRHQLEADVEPFRGILLGLFFMSVGMTLDLSVLLHDWPRIVIGVLVLMLVKSAGVYAVARVMGAQNREAIYRSALLAQGGEFAFVLYSAATAVGVLPGDLNALLTAIVILSMALTPISVLILRQLLSPPTEESMDGIEMAESLHGKVLIIGFGRFGQVCSQTLLARGIDVSIIDTDTQMIRVAATFGFKVYYGDGTRLDVLHACGADQAQAILVCIEVREATTRIVELVKAQFPQAKVLARAFDRPHAIQLVTQQVDYQVRETFESALLFGQNALMQLGVTESDAIETAADIRSRDSERFELELTGGIGAGRDLMRGNVPTPTPFTKPTRKPQALNEAAASKIGG